MSRNNWVKSLGVDGNGSLFVETDNGIILYDFCRDTSFSAARIVHPQDLMRIENRQLYYSFFSTLNEIDGIIFKSAYDGDYQFKKGDVIVDAGARIGTFSAKVSAAVGNEGKVIAVEPEPRNYQYLLKNIEMNRWNNVVAVQKMLWSTRTEKKLYLSGYSSAHSAYGDEFYNWTGDYITVEADTLDNILADQGVAAVDFIKMDIEGSEVEALKGMEKVLGCNVQMAIAAYHPLEGHPTNEDIIPWLRDLGFDASYSQEGIVQARRRSKR